MVIKLRFALFEQNQAYHKRVDVEIARADNLIINRPFVGIDINISQYTDVDTLTHELGHVIGVVRGAT